MKKYALSYLAIAALALTAAAQPIKWTASSTLAPQGKNRYDVTNLQNADPSVAWCEGVKGQGIGERVNAKIIASDSTHIKSLLIVNGYAKDQTTWKNNSRIKTLRLYAGGKHLGDLHLSDIIKPQAIQLPESIAIKGGHQLDLSFEIAEVYPGSKFEDACVTTFTFEAYDGTNIIDLRDGQTYRIVKIGTQTWMAQNLNFKTKKSKCYDNKESNCAKYGRLYDWEEARKICPASWHLPSNDEWNALITYVGGKGTEGTKLKAKSDWNDYDGESGNGTDEYGFSALPGGIGYSDGDFNHVGSQGSWWNSSGAYNSRSAYTQYMGSRYGHVGMSGQDKESGYLESVRCMQGLVADADLIPKSFYAGMDITDPRDGQTYRTVKIGNDTWMAQNLNLKTENSQCNSNKESNCAKYGRLYIWQEAMNACPAGWHLPSNKEWEALINYAGGRSIAGMKLKAASGWNVGKDCIEGTDQFGFSALPGDRYADSDFERVSGGNWWTSSAIGFSVTTNHIRCCCEDVQWYSNSKLHLLSVRCVKDLAEAKAAAPTVAIKQVATVVANSITDPRDKQTYRTVKIGNKTWMAQNLNFKTDNSQCNSNKESNCAKYGRLYNWEEAMVACPAGWHLPGDDEWSALVAYAGGEKIAGTKLKTTSDWNETYFIAPEKGGTDDFGFSALPGGYYANGTYSRVGDYGYGYWWCATNYEYNSNYAYYRDITPSYSMVSRDHDIKTYLFSVRCVQEAK